MSISNFSVIVLVSRLVLFWSRLLLKWWGKVVPRPVIWVNHRRLVNVAVTKIVLPQCLHMVIKLTSYRWRPAIMSTIVLIPLTLIIVGKLFCVFGLGLFLMSSLDDSRSKFFWRSWRSGSASRVLRTIRCLRRFRLLETVVLTSVILRSISAFIRVHNDRTCVCCINWYSMRITEISGRSTRVTGKLVIKAIKFKFVNPVLSALLFKRIRWTTAHY